MAERPIRPGEAFRIFTGAPLPEAADSIIPQEDVRVDGPTLLVPRPVREGDFVRPRGEDMRRRERVSEIVRVLLTAALAALAPLGPDPVSAITRHARGDAD